MIRPPKIIVWLSSTTFLKYGRVGGFFFSKIFFSKSKSKLHEIITHLSPNEGVNKSTLPKESLQTSFKSVLRCKQVDNNNF